MRVLTFNLRFANPQDGPNAWEYRKELVVETILAINPDLVGTQEGTVPQLDYLTDRLPGFLPLVAHRQVDPTCQYPTIFYRQGFQVEDSGEFWLSETPTVHRSLSWGSAFPRMVTYGLFQESGRDLWFYFSNTHLDHISALARIHGARLIREFFGDQGRPLILAGDFNEAPDGAVFQALTGPCPGLADTWRALHPPGEDPPTQHHFDGQPRGHRIDWVLATPPFRVIKAAVVRYNSAGRYPSDHFPYIVEVEY
jgi:endonuclease/exonuclease/phosphatase family metal-dependent hydrolase